MTSISPRGRSHPEKESMRTRNRTFRTATTVTAAVLVALPLGACSEDTGAVDTDDAVETTDDDPVEPQAGLDPATLSFEDISDDLDERVGEEVMVEAEVEDVITPGVFTINDQTGNDLESIVVVGVNGTEDIEADMPIVLTGIVERSLQPSKVDRLLDVQLEDEMLTDYEEQPYIRALMVHEGAA